MKICRFHNLKKNIKYQYNSLKFLLVIEQVLGYNIQFL